VFGIERVDGDRKCQVKVAIILCTVHFTPVEEQWPKVIMLELISNGQG